MTKAVFKDTVFALSGLCCVTLALLDTARANPFVTALLLITGFVFLYRADAKQRKRTAEERKRREGEEVGPFTYLLK